MWKRWTALPVILVSVVVLVVGCRKADTPPPTLGLAALGAPEPVDGFARQEISKLINLYQLTHSDTYSRRCGADREFSRGLQLASLVAVHRLEALGDVAVPVVCERLRRPLPTGDMADEGWVLLQLLVLQRNFML